MAAPDFFNFRENARRLIIVSAGVSLALIAGIVFVLWQSAARIDAIAGMRRNLAATQIAFNQLSTLRSEQQRAEPYLRQLRIVFPDEEALFTLTGSLQDAAEKNRVRQNFAFGSVYQGDANSQKNIGFTLTAQATLGDFVSYLRALEQMPFFIDVGNIEVNKTDQGYQFNTLGRIILR